MANEVKPETPKPSVPVKPAMPSSAPGKKLDLTTELSRMRGLYEADARNTSFKAIVYGPSGSGKTTSLKTARFPLLVHSFDPGGTQVLRPLVDEGKAMLNTTFEVDNPKAPSAFRNWDIEFDNLERGGFFEHVGTYVIDSLTTWAQCALYEILKRAGRAGSVPQQNDWYPQMILLEAAMRKLLSLPCDVILIGHDDVSKDEQSGKIFRGLLITGKLTKRIPILFDELYFANVKETSKGAEYQFMTKDNGSINAKTRLGNKGELDQYVPQDFKAILAKVGRSTADKPLWRE